MEFELGQKVKLSHTGEVGIIVWQWENKELGIIDTYVAIFGYEFPEGKPDPKPAIQRYNSEAFEIIE